MQHSPAEPVPAEHPDHLEHGGHQASREETGERWPEEPFPRLLPWLLVIGGAVGLLAAFVLAVEKIALLKNPEYVPSCSINPVLSCGSIMTTPQAELFGFPNPLLGVAGFAVIVTVGAALLAGADLGRWFWLGLQVGVTCGAVFVHWLIFQSLYVIGALCPYCMIVWAVTIPLFWYVTVHNLARGHLPGGGGPGVPPARGARVVAALRNYHSAAIALWFGVVIALIAVRFWSFWITLI
ncbi:vitamin K epoxide reductase family protein [Streptosporangium sp. NBC_01469]|uniref:vitamin K epoxide reductase family protein n=1 Tax=Streptosporangium sp. NBC_01469 TaxID=2903898 RepID=UPI002E292DB3|nr:vitamin K epoxide reductase family protein [Streptosporangium sp. NBC_01469]